MGCKMIKISISLFIACFILYSCSDKKYIEYKPHYVSPNGEYKYLGESKLDSNMYRNIKHVLDFYNQEYKTEKNNTVLISEKLSEDWNLLWNYTTKANDGEWLDTHKPKNKL